MNPAFERDRYDGNTSTTLTLLALSIPRLLTTIV